MQLKASLVRALIAVIILQSFFPSSKFYNNTFLLGFDGDESKELFLEDSNRFESLIWQVVLCRELSGCRCNKRSSLVVVVDDIILEGFKPQDANYLVDNFLEILRVDLVQQDLHRINLPDIDETLLLSAEENGFVASGGYVDNAISIRRTGEFSIDRVFGEDTFLLHGYLAFHTLVAKYGPCVINVDIFHSEEELELDCGQNSVKFSILGKFIECDVIKVYDFIFRITNLNYIRAANIESKILLESLKDTSIFTRIQADIIQTIEFELRKAIEKFFIGVNYKIPLLDLSDQDDSE